MEEILKELEKQKKISQEEFFQKINQKIEDLFGLITQDAAAYLVAKDFGVELPQLERKPLQIKNIIPGIRNVSFVGRVFKISPINEFQKKNGKGRVVNIFIADNTGYVRIPLWNDQVKMVENGEVNLGDILQISGGSAQENIYGDTEVSLGKFGTISPAEGFFDLPMADELSKNYFSNVPQRTKLSEIVPGNLEVCGTIIQLMGRKFIFESGGEKAMMISCIIDDGTGDLRIVFFRNLAEELTSSTVNEILNIPEENRYSYLAQKVLGKEIVVIGKVKKNERFDALEMVADELKALNPLDESKKLAEEIQLLLGD